jgi:hypothetical protein
MPRAVSGPISGRMAGVSLYSFYAQRSLFSVAVMDLTDGVDIVCHLRVNAPLCFGILTCFRLCLQVERGEGEFVVGYLGG